MLFLIAQLLAAAEPAAQAPAVPFAEPPEIEFKRQVYGLLRRLEDDPDFAGVKANGPFHVSIYFKGNAAAHLARYTKDPRIDAVPVAVSARELREIADRFLAWAERRGFHASLNAIDGRESRAAISAFEPEEVIRAARRDRLDLKYLLIMDAVPHYAPERG